MPEPSRHQLGQWFTPEPVADLALALALRGAAAGAKILDPSCGDGVFLRQARKMGIAAKRLYGVDIDSHAIASAASHVPEAHLVHADFFEPQASLVGAGLLRADVIVGNPPYVRQERLSAEAKDLIALTLAADWPQLDKAELRSLVGRSDFAAPFLLRALSHLRAGGTAALVISSAFLDSGYGAQFWKLLAKVASLTMLVDAPKERWFEDAAVNAVIAVFRATPQQGEVTLARLRTTTEEAAAHVAKGGSLSKVANLRHAPQSSPKQWAAGLRAPDAWFRFVREAGEHLTTLGEVAEIRRGVTSGANEIFYLRREQALQLQIPAAFLKPLLQAPGRARQAAVRFDSEQSVSCALVIPASTKLADYPALKRYLDSFDHAGDRRTLAAREPWWALRVRPAQVFLSKAYAKRFVQPYCATPVVADQRIYCLHPIAGVEPALLSAILNSTATSLAIESLGRSSMGEGALEWTVADARKMPILDPRKVACKTSVLQAFSAIQGRDIGSIDDESARDDRAVLDGHVLAVSPGLRAMRHELSDALVATCIARQRRAKA